MTITVSNLAETLQTLFTTTADELARETRFVRRTRIITGASFAQALTFGWLHDRDATREELADTLGVRPQSLHDRFDSHARDFFTQLLAHAVQQAFAATRTTVKLLQRFSHVFAEDCTVIPLPKDAADRWPGCGGNSPDAGAAALKVFTRWELTTGAIQTLHLSAGKTPDVTAGKLAPDPPPGSLLLADMGFFDLTRLARWNSQGIYWITRIPARTTFTLANQTQSLSAYLAVQTSDTIDVPIRLGVLGVGCRLVARRCPASVAAKRLARQEETARRKQRRVSDEQRVLCEWTVFATNVSADEWNGMEVWTVYRLRWQIELLFKGWKSQGGVSCSRGRRGVGVECEVLAKLLGQVVCQWAMLLRGGPLVGVNPVAARRRVQRQAEALRVGLVGGVVATVLRQLQASLQRLTIPTRRRPTTRQLLSRKHLAA